MQALRKREPKTCEPCGQEFLGLKKQRFCSTNCRVKAFQKGKRKLAEALGVEARELMGPSR